MPATRALSVDAAQLPSSIGVARVRQHNTHCDQYQHARDLSTPQLQ